MTSPSRPRRPELERDEPNRTFSGAFGGRPEAPPEAAAPDGADDVGRGVGAGYRLIEDYLKRGQEVAAKMWSVDPRMPRGMPPGVGAGPERLLEYSTQVVSLWFEMMSKAWPTPAAPENPERPGGFDFVTPSAEPEPAPASAEVSRKAPEKPQVSLDVTSSLPVEVTADLSADCRGKELLAFDLRVARGDGPRIEGVETAWVDAGRVRISLRIPEAQPPGTYSGVVVDAATNLPMGTISVSVRAR